MGILAPNPNHHCSEVAVTSGFNLPRQVILTFAKLQHISHMSTLIFVTTQGDGVYHIHPYSASCPELDGERPDSEDWPHTSGQPVAG